MKANSFFFLFLRQFSGLSREHSYLESGIDGEQAWLALMSSSAVIWDSSFCSSLISSLGSVLPSGLDFTRFCKSSSWACLIWMCLFRPEVERHILEHTVHGYVGLGWRGVWDLALGFPILSRDSLWACLRFWTSAFSSWIKFKKLTCVYLHFLPCEQKPPEM